MGFISFNEKYYLHELSNLENKKISVSEIYKAKQLLKVLDDLADEGYTNLINHLENNFACISRLRKIISESGEKPFEIISKKCPSNIIYSKKEYELVSFIKNMVLKAQAQKSTYNTCHDNPLLKDILLYSKWIGYKKDTAYVFLLRDTLLPYVFFLNQNRENIYPWLISRDFLKQITGSENIDDDIRSPIYETLENGYENFSEFAIFCKRKILSVLDKHPVLKNTLKELMSSLPHKKIIVIKSGYCGTIPMLLSAVDNRVTFKMFTTAPFLYNTYSKNIFCRKYEKIRLFETLRSQDLLMRYSSYRNKKFYIKMIDNPDVIWESLSEINFFGEISRI